MVILKSAAEIETIAKACAVVAKTLAALERHVRPGVTTGELDQLAEEMIRAKGALPAFQGYRGYNATLCTSVNEEVVHGIPGKRRLEAGDIVGIDCGAIVEGFYGDAARTFPVGEVSGEVLRLLAATQEALDQGLAQVVVGNRLHDISWAVQNCSELKGFSVVRDFVGHGIGRSLHEEPPVPNYGQPHTGIRLEVGLVLAIEPMVNIGTHEVEVLADGWTAVTKDRKLSAHFEDTVALTAEGPRILTRL